MNNVVSIQDRPLVVKEVLDQAVMIQQIIAAVMIEDVHYGIIPGTKTKTLYKPGAEKLMSTFRLTADPEIIDLSEPDLIRYQIKVRINSASGTFLGTGVGECSSNEEKFKWRGALCDAEFDAAEPSRRRVKWTKGKWDDNARSYSEPYPVQQIRTEPSDLANTVLKMAKKRALVDGVITATAASDCFSQDLEDLPPEYIDGVEQPRQQTLVKKTKTPQAKSKTTIQHTGMATEPQVKLLHGKLKSSGKSVAEYCEAMGVESVEKTPFAKVNDAIAWVTQ